MYKEQKSILVYTVIVTYAIHCILWIYTFCVEKYSIWESVRNIDELFVYVCFGLYCRNILHSNKAFGKILLCIIKVLTALLLISVISVILSIIVGINTELSGQFFFSAMICLFIAIIICLFYAINKVTKKD